jgi:hypothetical protein
MERLDVDVNIDDRSHGASPGSGARRSVGRLLEG